MRIGISIDPAPGTGIARYTRSLLQALDAHAPTACSVEAFGFGIRAPRPPWLPDAIGYRSISLPGRVQRLLCGDLRLPVERLFTLSHADVIHTVDLQPVSSRMPLVLTVHDVAWRHVGQRYETVVGSRWVRRAERAIRRADHICADSAATAHDLVRGGIPAKKISVVHLGVEPHFRRASAGEVDRIRRKYDLPVTFLLYVGAVNVRKNIPLLVEALSSFTAAPTLVIAGPRPAEGLEYWGLDRIPSRHLGYLPEGELPALYSAAALVVCPSVCEGFGLPLLEAMATGTPVVASEIAVFKELAGDVPLYFDPADAAVLKVSLERVLHDSDLRREMERRGPERAARFTWDACAESTLHAYETATR